MSEIGRSERLDLLPSWVVLAHDRAIVHRVDGWPSGALDGL
jgi:hypothetical protein